MFSLLEKLAVPCCWFWGLKKTATDSITNIIARAKEAITENFYTDNYLDSFNTQSEAMEIPQQVMTAVKDGSFRLTKWISNDGQVIPLSDTLPLSEKSAASINLDLDDTSIESALGIQWNPKTDILQIKVSDRDTAMAKRGILSDTSWMFDILGILAPLILEQKLIIQSLWKMKVDWVDKDIPYNLKNRFERWKTATSAYDAVAYFRCKYQSKFKCNFINSKQD